MIGLAPLAVWAGPVLAVSLASRVFRGEPDAPLLVLLAIAAPLVALVSSGERLPMTPASAGLALPGLALILGANLLLVERLLHSSGVPRPVAAIIGMLILLAPIVVATGNRAASWLTAAGIAGIVVPVLAVACATGAAPWTAWARTASRPAILFSEGSPAVTSGRPIGVTGELVFLEPHRVTAAASAAVRVVETDGDHRRVHERQLASGDSVHVRPGDRLLLDGDAHLRFEPGKRIPGAAVSGATWADPPERQRPGVVLGMVGVAVTILGAALALVGPAPARRLDRPSDGSTRASGDGHAGGRGAVVATTVLAAFSLAAGSLGIYAMDAVPELLVGATLLTPLLEAPAMLLPSYGHLPEVLVGMACLALFAGMTFVLASRVTQVVSAVAPRCAAAGPPRIWTALATVAGVGTLWGGDAWTMWLMGLGLVAAGWAAPSLGARDERGAVAGGVVGMTAFAGLVWLSPAASPWAAVAATPALVAAPLGWAAAWVVSRAARPPRRVAAPARRGHDPVQ